METKELTKNQNFSPSDFTVIVESIKDFQDLQNFIMDNAEFIQINENKTMEKVLGAQINKRSLFYLLDKIEEVTGITKKQIESV